MEAPALFDFDLAKVLDSHRSLDGEVSQRVVVLFRSAVLQELDGKQAYGDSLLLTFIYEIESSEFLEPMSSVFTRNQ